jgi:hypothetical protein
MTGGRYRADPRRKEGKVSLTDILLDMQRRLRAGEVAPRIGNTSIDDGNLTVRNGDIIVSLTDGTEVLRIVHGDVPEIRYFATGVDTDRFGAVWGEDRTFDLGPSFGTVDTTVMNMGVYDASVPEDHVRDGGEVRLYFDGAQLVYEPNNGDNDLQFTLNQYGRTPPFQDVIYMQGKWDINFDFGSEGAISTGSIPVSAGFGSFTWFYTQTFASTIAPVIGLVAATANFDWCVSEMPTDKFSVDWSDTTAKTINYWNPRL